MKDKFDLLIEFTKDEDPRNRAMALAGLAKIGDPRGFASVLVALFDPVDEVRVTAATALGVFKDERALEPLVECVKDPNPQVAINSIWALGQIPGERSVHQLLEILDDATCAPELRIAGVTSLGEHISANNALLQNEEFAGRMRKSLMPLLQDESDELRATSVWALGHLPHDDAAVDAFIAALNDPYNWVVCYAIEALANAGDRRAIDPLRAMEADDREQVRDLVAKALERLG